MKGAPYHPENFPPPKIFIPLHFSTGSTFGPLEAGDRRKGEGGGEEGERRETRGERRREERKEERRGEEIYLTGDERR